MLLPVSIPYSKELVTQDIKTRTFIQLNMEDGKYNKSAQQTDFWPRCTSIGHEKV